MLKPTDKRFLPDTITVFNPSVDGKIFYPCVIKCVNFNDKKAHNFRITGTMANVGFNIIYDIVNSEPQKQYIDSLKYNLLNDEQRQNEYFTLSGNMSLIKGEYPLNVPATELTASKFKEKGLELYTSKMVDETFADEVGNIQIGG